MIGRRQELAQLEQLLQDLQGVASRLPADRTHRAGADPDTPGDSTPSPPLRPGGPDRVVLIAGEAGIGKTTLAEEAIARSSLPVFRSRAVGGVMPAYGLLAAALRDAIRRRDVPAPQTGPYAAHLRCILHELGVPPAQTDAQLQLEAFLEALDALSEGSPSILFLDDLQWADHASLELLPLLAERLEDRRLVLLAAYRSDGLPRGHRLRWLRNELRRRRPPVEINLTPLGPGETAALAEPVLGGKVSPSLAGTLHGRSQGVPLFIEELCLALQSRLRTGPEGLELFPGEPVPIPESIRDMVLVRLEHLSEAERRTLEAAAVAGSEFDLEMIAELSGDEAALDALLEHHLILGTREGRGAFRNDLIRETVLGAIPWSQQRRLNRQVASLLESRGAPPERVAEHWAAAGELVGAREALLAAAELSCRLHAYRDAAHAAHRALEIWPEGEQEGRRLAALERLAYCAEVGGQLADAARAWREVLASPLVREDLSRQAEAHRRLATVYGLQNAWKLHFESRRLAAEAFEAGGAWAEAAAEWLAGAARSTGLYDLTQALNMSERAAELARRAQRPDLEARALGLKGNVLSISGRHQDGIKIATDALSMALERHEIDAAAEVYRRLGTTLEYASEYASSRDTYLTAYEYCKREGESVQAKLCLSCMSWVLFRTGDWRRCMEVSREVIQDPADAFSQAMAGCVLGLVRVYRGENHEARELLESAHRIGLREQSPLAEMIACWGLALLAEFSDQPEDASSHYLRILEIRRELGDTHDCLTALFSGVSFFAARKAEQEASRCVSALSEIAAGTGNFEALAILAFALGEMAALHGDPDEAARKFTQALGQMEKLGVPVEHSWVEARLGRTLVEAGNRLDGVGRLRSSYRRARNLGARPLAARIAAILRSLGESAEEPRDPSAGSRVLVAGLTQRQVEIVRLVAQGFTNKEIAQQLFLSPRTVEMHVANLLNRLECRNRSEAVRKASELGLIEGEEPQTMPRQ